MRPLPPSILRAIERHGEGLVILVVRLGAMGDIVRTLPAVRLVRFNLPEARVHWVAWETWAPLLRGHPEIDGIVTIPRSEWRRMSRSPRTWLPLGSAARRVASRIRALAPGLALDFHGDLRSGLVSRISGAPVRLGYSGHQQKEGNRLFTTNRVSAGDRRRSRLERNLDLVRALGLPATPVPDAGIVFGRADERAAEEVLRACGVEGAYALLNAGASARQAYKKPPAPLLAAAARAAADRGVTPIAVHGPGEDGEARAVIEASAGAARLAPETSLSTLGALLRGSRLFVGGDSGPLHLACGVGCPVVGIYGPTDPVVNAPWNVPSITVAPEGRVYTGIKSKDRTSGGFSGVTESTVVDAVNRLLSR